MRPSSFVTAFALALSAVALGADATWSQYRGPKANGIVLKAGVNTAWTTRPPKVLWEVPLTDQGYTGPVSAGGLVYIVDHKGDQDIVRALSLKNGIEAWRYSYTDAPQASYGFARSTPCLDGDRLYVVSRLGKVVCLTAKAGKLVWKLDMMADMGGKMLMHGYAGSPIIDGKRLIVAPNAPDATIAALDKATGAVLLKAGTGAPAYATPVIATIEGKKQYVCLQADKLVGIDASTGQELWSFPWETTYGINASQPVVTGDSVYISAGYGMGCALVDIKGSKATARWKNRSLQQNFSSAILVGGYLYGTGDPGVLVCLDAATGNTAWKQPGFEKGSLIGVDGVILVNDGANGDLVMVKTDPKAYQEVGRIKPLKGQAWTAPILVGKTLIIRNLDAIAAVDLG